MRTFVPLAFTLLALSLTSLPAQTDPAVNLALAATPSTSFVSPWESLGAINDGLAPQSSFDYAHGAYGNWPEKSTQWVQYDWAKPILTDGIDVYFYDDHRGLHLPVAYRLLYWDAEAGDFKPVPEATGLGVEKDAFNHTSFPTITTTRLRLELDPEADHCTGILEWKVSDSGGSPLFPPRLTAGPDRTVVIGGRTYLDATVITTGQPGSTPTLHWTKLSGPGDVTFEDAAARSTSATFSTLGDYELAFAGTAGGLTISDKLQVHVVPPAPLAHLSPVPVTPYTITTPFWDDRLKNLVENWIPHCVTECEDPDLKEGGINNLLEAAKKLAGQPAQPHRGYPFSNAWVLNTFEAACLAQLLDPAGDLELAKAQHQLRDTIEKWIPIVLAAQEPDGYFQTRFTLGTDWDKGTKPQRWSERLRGEHEGYVAGYFLEAAIAHYRMTDGKDRRMYDAAKRLADCWDSHIGPAPKQRWFDGHQEMELALFRFSRLVDEAEGPGAGKRYATLAKFLLDCRGVAMSSPGAKYDQSYLPVTRQYDAVGHAVRAMYNYTAMAEVVSATGDLDYQSAVSSLWDSVVDRKYYVTGGVGSGETSEGFGDDYSLPNDAYCESCANIGLLFFQQRMMLAYAQSRYADLYEDTLYNAILSDLDIHGENFTYTNALDTEEARYKWHVCPCCVGNIARAMLSLPTWTYSAGSDGVYVNLFIGGTMRVPNVAGTTLHLQQKTSYPWGNQVSLVVDPEAAATFAVHIRVPERDVSKLYTVTPTANGLGPITVNGEAVTPRMLGGYAVIERRWLPGDKVEFSLPLEAQRVRCDSQVAADRGRVALRYGPLLYNVEAADQSLDSLVLPKDAKLTTEWQPDLLGGVLTIHATGADGKPVVAIPNYTRNNRGGRSIVWMREE